VKDVKKSLITEYLNNLQWQTTDILIRHDKICTHIPRSVLKELDTEAAENWYMPKSVANGNLCNSIMEPRDKKKVFGKNATHNN